MIEKSSNKNSNGKVSSSNNSTSESTPSPTRLPVNNITINDDDTHTEITIEGIVSVEDVTATEHIDPQSSTVNKSLTKLERNPMPLCLLEMECPIRSVTRVNSAEGSDNVVLAIGTNQKSLKLGKLSKNRPSFDIIYEWNNSHNGSIYCLDVLGKLGKSETCLLATGSNDKCIRIFRADTKEVSASIKGHTGTIRNLKFCKIENCGNSQLLASVVFLICCRHKYTYMDFNM